jgi:hypothetical protein
MLACVWLLAQSEILLGVRAVSRQRPRSASSRRRKSWAMAS